jgi:sporulation protein YlmC with PRC-barrel domain
MKTKVIMGITVATLCIGSTAFAQQDRTERTPGQDRERTPAIQQQQTTPRGQARPQIEGRRDQQQAGQRLGAGRDIPGEKPEKINRAKKLIGMEIKNHKDEKVGKIDDVVIDLDSGRVAYVVLSTEGIETGRAQQQPGQQTERAGQQPGQEQAQRPGQPGQQSVQARQGQHGEGKLIAAPLGAFVKSSDGESLILHVEKDRLATAQAFSEENLPEMTTGADPVVMSFWQIYVVDPAGAQPGQQQELQQRQQELRERFQQEQRERSQPELRERSQQEQQQQRQQQQPQDRSGTPERRSEPNR